MPLWVTEIQHLKLQHRSTSLDISRLTPSNEAASVRRITNAELYIYPSTLQGASYGTMARSIGEPQRRLTTY